MECSACKKDPAGEGQGDALCAGCALRYSVAGDEPKAPGRVNNATPWVIRGSFWASHGGGNANPGIPLGSECTA